MAGSTISGPDLHGASVPFVMPSEALSGPASIDSTCWNLCIDNFLRLWLSLVALPDLTQMISLDFEQAGLNCRGVPQSPQQAG